MGKREAAPTAAAPTAGVRYHHLDALRGVLMLIGVFVHVATLGDDPVFDGIARASGLFRMETFFVVSGFLSAMLTAKYGSGLALRRRLAAVGVPLAATLVLFNPPTLWLISRFHNRSDISFVDFVRACLAPAFEGRLNWYLHLWFLLVLLGYALLTPAAVKLLGRLVSTRVYRRATAGRLRAMATITLLVLGTMAAGRIGWEQAIRPGTGSGFHADLIRRTLEFLPFFLLGLLLYLDRGRLVPSFQRPAPVLLAVSGLVLLASWHGWVNALAIGTGRVLAETMFAIPVIAMIFAAASRWGSRPSPALRYLADASYSVYLLHFFWIYVFATLLGFDPGLGSARMTLLVVATYAATFATHHLVILRFPLLRRVFNGRFPPKTHTGGRTPAAVPEAPPPAAPAFPSLAVPALPPLATPAVPGPAGTAGPPRA
ncbi:glucans biosynthesis protein MdoC [Parafrankia discariae]|uniref:glucans biosynthesis protein MdoC n=1 Tax=Parafrankia discariae TaxID=365528 RepID=UPI0003A1BE8A|nr:glucans biosynthesis protein MdoC [Parafrankia discariae]